MLEVVRVQSDAELESFLRLAQDYVDWMLDEIARVYPELDRQSFRDEHGYDDIRKKFSGADILFLAKDGADFCGCVALGKLSDEICEMRTMFVRPEHRGKRLGKLLAETTLSEARKQNYQKMRLDTLDFMNSARKLYEGLGFYEIEAYIELPDSLKRYIHFLECKLD